MKTKEWQDKWLEFASWPCNSRVERAGRWATIQLETSRTGLKVSKSADAWVLLIIGHLQPVVLDSCQLSSWAIHPLATATAFEPFALERAATSHKQGCRRKTPELVLAKLMQNTYMHFCYLAACQSSVKAGKACNIGPFGRCDTKQSRKQTFVGHIFACSFCSACVFTLNGSYLLSGTITWRPRSDRTNDLNVHPVHETQELRGLRCWLSS